MPLKEGDFGACFKDFGEMYIEIKLAVLWCFLYMKYFSTGKVRLMPVTIFLHICSQKGNFEPKIYELTIKQCICFNIFFHQNDTFRTFSLQPRNNHPKVIVLQKFVSRVPIHVSQD